MVLFFQIFKFDIEPLSSEICQSVWISNHENIITQCSRVSSYQKKKTVAIIQYNTITYLSAPAHDNILLIRITWNGCNLIRIWNWSLPQCFTRYLLQQIRPASRASELSCSYSSETKWTHSGKSSTVAFFFPKSKILILGSGTPRQKRDFGYGLFLQ